MKQQASLYSGSFPCKTISQDPSNTDQPPEIAVLSSLESSQVWDNKFTEISEAIIIIYQLRFLNFLGCSCSGWKRRVTYNGGKAQEGKNHFMILRLWIIPTLPGQSSIMLHAENQNGLRKHRPFEQHIPTSFPFESGSSYDISSEN